MVLGYLGVGVTPERLAADVFHPALDIYGVWPAAVSAAARRGIPGYLLRFPDWTAAAWCLDHGLPIIARSEERRVGEEGRRRRQREQVQDDDGGRVESGTGR